MTGQLVGADAPLNRDSSDGYPFTRGRLLQNLAANPFAPSYRAQATGFQQQIQATHPHVKYVELFRRGYLLLDLDRDRVQGEWYHLRTIAERSTDADLGRVLRVANNETSLTVTTTASAPRTGVAPLAP